MNRSICPELFSSAIGESGLYPYAYHAAIPKFPQIRPRALKLAYPFVAITTWSCTAMPSI